MESSGIWPYRPTLRSGPASTDASAAICQPVTTASSTARRSAVTDPARRASPRISPPPCCQRITPAHAQEIARIERERRLEAEALAAERLRELERERGRTWLDRLLGR